MVGNGSTARLSHVLMKLAQKWRTQCMALLVAAGCGAHSPVNPPTSSPDQEAALAQRPQDAPEPERCISRKIRDKIQCVGVERRARHRPVPLVSASADPGSTAPHGRRRRVDLAPEQELVQPSPVLISGATVRTGPQLRAVIAELEPPRRGSDALEQLVEVKVARARAYFEAGRFEEAAAAFREVAIHHPDAEPSSYAARQYVESMNVLASKAQRPQALCFDDLKRDLPTLLALHCTSAKMSDNEEECAVMRRIRDGLGCAAGSDEEGQCRRP